MKYSYQRHMLLQFFFPQLFRRTGVSGTSLHPRDAIVPGAEQKGDQVLLQRQGARCGGESPQPGGGDAFQGTGGDFAQGVRSVHRRRHAPDQGERQVDVDHSEYA